MTLKSTVDITARRLRGTFSLPLGSDLFTCRGSRLFAADRLTSLRVTLGRGDVFMFGWFLSRVGKGAHCAPLPALTVLVRTDPEPWLRSWAPGGDGEGCVEGVVGASQHIRDHQRVTSRTRDSL